MPLACEECDRSRVDAVDVLKMSRLLNRTPDDHDPPLGPIAAASPIPRAARIENRLFETQSRSDGDTSKR